MNYDVMTTAEPLSTISNPKYLYSAHWLIAPSEQKVNSPYVELKPTVCAFPVSKRLWCE